jgi:hypothetical protein
MSNTIDCSVMSHVACEEPEPATATSVESQASAPMPQGATESEPLVASYDCINRCASSLGAVTLVEGAIAGLGCLAMPPACPAFIAAVPVTVLEACDTACRELEKP